MINVCFTVCPARCLKASLNLLQCSPGSLRPSTVPEERLNQVAQDLAESVRITDILSQKIEAVERQFTLELSSHKEANLWAQLWIPFNMRCFRSATAQDVVQKLQVVREVSPKDGEDPGARLEDCFGKGWLSCLASPLWATEHLEQSLVAMTNGHSSKISSEVSDSTAYLQAEINDLKSRSTSCETRQ
eukprot:s4866_g6.t1